MIMCRIGGLTVELAGGQRQSQIWYVKNPGSGAPKPLPELCYSLLSIATTLRLFPRTTTDAGAPLYVPAT